VKVLITSGGTKVPIDPVRDITNMSKGTFGCRIAVEYLNERHHVIYFVSQDGKSPFEFRKNLYVDPLVSRNQCVRTMIHGDQSEAEFKKHKDWCVNHCDQYRESRYRNYDDYCEGLESIIKTFAPDVIILSAAVSDYIAVPSVGKVKSSSELTIQLTPALKIISKIKEWCPHTFLVGFKLLVDSTPEKLIEASRNSIDHNHCDLVVANDLVSLRNGKHELLLIDKSSVIEVRDNLAFSIVERVNALIGK